MAEKNGNELKAAGRLGTFTGVFTPRVLTILGIILFLRHGILLALTVIALGPLNFVARVRGAQARADKAEKKAEGVAGKATTKPAPKIE